MAEVTRTIELREHRGVKDDGTEVVFAQDQVLVNGVRWGYVGHEPGAAMNIIRPGAATDKGTLAAIEAAIEQKFGARPGKISVAPQIIDEEQLDLQEAR